jgi:hypothetical protein
MKTANLTPSQVIPFRSARPLHGRKHKLLKSRSNMAHNLAYFVLWALIDEAPRSAG